MIALVAIALLAALWVLMVRHGHDSRDGLRSKEQDLASYGVTWHEPADPWALPLLAHERQANLRERVADAGPLSVDVAPPRAGLARCLRRPSDRLEPAGAGPRRAHA